MERATGDEGKLIENLCVVCARYFQLLTRMPAPVENHEAKVYQRGSNVICDYILRNEKCRICFYLLIIARCFPLCLSGSSTLLRWENWWPCIFFLLSVFLSFCYEFLKYEWLPLCISGGRFMSWKSKTCI